MKTIKLKGFTANSIKQLEAAGWIKGIECGYRNHSGFVKDSAASGRHFSLTPLRSGRYTLATIVRGIAEFSSVVTIEEALQR